MSRVVLVVPVRPAYSNFRLLYPQRNPPQPKCKPRLPCPTMLQGGSCGRASHTDLADEAKAQCWAPSVLNTGDGRATSIFLSGFLMVI